MRKSLNFIENIKTFTFEATLIDIAPKEKCFYLGFSDHEKGISDLVSMYGKSGFKIAMDGTEFLVESFTEMPFGIGDASVAKVSYKTYN